MILRIQNDEILHLKYNSKWNYELQATLSHLKSKKNKLSQQT